MSEPLAGSASSSSQGASVSNIFGAFGSLLGYVGAEAITESPFERLLWPQRSWSSFGRAQVLWVALLTPMGGPMYKAALTVFDTAYNHGLLDGALQGHMLGTTFFPDLCWRSDAYFSRAEPHKQEPEALRNCIWARAMARLAFAEPNRQQSPTTGVAGGPNSERGCEEDGPDKKHEVRSIFRVSHLNLTAATSADKYKPTHPFVGETCGTTSRNVIMAILTGELSAIATAVGVAVGWRSLWAIMWLFPLALRLLSAVFALQRKKLETLPEDQAATDISAKMCYLKVHYPQFGGQYLLISGPWKTVLQFTGHYGNPRRDRTREIIQLGVVVIFACLFPVELVCSTIWMPVGVQYVWLSYQLYVVLATYIARYTRLDSASGTEAAIARILTTKDDSQDSSMSSEHKILFGHVRYGPETVLAKVESKYYDKKLDAKEALQNLWNTKVAG